MAEFRPDRTQGILVAAGIGALAGARLGTRGGAVAAAAGGIVLLGSETVARIRRKPGRAHGS